jgi:hypothetical protein
LHLVKRAAGQSQAFLDLARNLFAKRLAPVQHVRPIALPPANGLAEFIGLFAQRTQVLQSCFGIHVHTLI